MAGKSTCDVLQGGERTNFPRWREMRVIVPWVDIIPGIENWDKRKYSEAGDAVMMGHTVTTPQYNTNLVSAAEAPKSWEDLLHPKWRGQLGHVTDPKVWVVLATDGGWGIERKP